MLLEYRGRMMWYQIWQIRNSFQPVLNSSVWTQDISIGEVSKNVSNKPETDQLTISCYEWKLSGCYNVELMIIADIIHANAYKIQWSFIW